MLQNAYSLAKIGADTAENEQHFAEILPKIGNYPTGPHGSAGFTLATPFLADRLKIEKEAATMYPRHLSLNCSQFSRLRKHEKCSRNPKSRVISLMKLLRLPSEFENCPRRTNKNSIKSAILIGSPWAVTSHRNRMQKLFHKPTAVDMQHSATTVFCCTR